jgi:hypothetical protein
MYEYDPNEDLRQTEPATLDRREFLKRVGGGVVVLFVTPPRLASGQAAAARTGAEPAFNAYLRIGEDGRVTCFTGKIEMGQGGPGHLGLAQHAGVRARVARRRGAGARRAAGARQRTPGRAAGATGNPGRFGDRP